MEECHQLGASGAVPCSACEWDGSVGRMPPWHASDAVARDARMDSEAQGMQDWPQRTFVCTRWYVSGRLKTPMYGGGMARKWQVEKARLEKSD